MIVGLSDKGKEVVKILMPILPYKIRKYIKISTNVFKLLSEDLNISEVSRILNSLRR